MSKLSDLFRIVALTANSPHGELIALKIKEQISFFVSAESLKPTDTLFVFECYRGGPNEKVEMIFDDFASHELVATFGDSRIFNVDGVKCLDIRGVGDHVVCRSELQHRGLKFVGSAQVQELLV